MASRGRVVTAPPLIPVPKEWGPWEFRNQFCGEHVPMFTPSGKLVTPELRAHGQSLAWVAVNNVYSVQCKLVPGVWGEVEHLMIRKHDQGEDSCVIPWYDKQRIKQMLCKRGELRWAFEAFPPNGDIIDAADIFHLWVMPEGFVPPFNLAAPKER